MSTLSQIVLFDTLKSTLDPETREVLLKDYVLKLTTKIDQLTSDLEETTTRLNYHALAHQNSADIIDARNADISNLNRRLNALQAADTGSDPSFILYGFLTWYPEKWDVFIDQHDIALIDQLIKQGARVLAMRLLRRQLPDLTPTESKSCIEVRQTYLKDHTLRSVIDLDTKSTFVPPKITIND